MEHAHEVNHVMEKGNDRFSEPSTPQLLHGERAVEAEKLIGMQKYIRYEAEFPESTDKHITGPMHSDTGLNADEASKTDDCSSAKEICLRTESENSDFENTTTTKKMKMKSSVNVCSCLNSKRGSRRKVDWTQELHRNFVKAVERLGIDQAIPSKILELMKVEGLTRHNVASHLQKFRMHRKHILPKEYDGRWRRVFQHKSCIQEPAVMPFIPSVLHSNYTFPASCQVYPLWPHQAYHLTNVVHMCGHSVFSTWHPPPDYGQNKTYPETHTDAWGCPVLLPRYSTYGQYCMPPQGSATMNCAAMDEGMAWKSSSDICPAEEIIDEVVKEALSKPWLPLPLGLKTPPTEKIIAELHHHGIHTIPSLPHRSRS